jgi:hypothetical protein
MGEHMMLDYGLCVRSVKVQSQQPCDVQSTIFKNSRGLIGLYESDMTFLSLFQIHTRIMKEWNKLKEAKTGTLKNKGYR